MRRSILTEKISRRGLHLSREYAIDPLETHFVASVMEERFVGLPDGFGPAEAAAALQSSAQGIYPVLGEEGRLVGVVNGADLETSVRDESGWTMPPILPAVVAHAHEPLRAIAHRMAETGNVRLVVLAPADAKIVGIISLEHLLQARAANVQAEHLRERHPVTSLISSRSRS
jgi:CBS domain-containing protein